MGQLGGSGHRSGLSYSRANLDADPGFKTGLWIPWASAGLSGLGPGFWAALCVKHQGPTSEAHARPLVTPAPARHYVPLPKAPRAACGCFPHRPSLSQSPCSSVPSPVRPVVQPVLNAGPLLAGLQSVVFTEFIVFLGMRLCDAITPTLRLLAKETFFIEIKLTQRRVFKCKM